MAPRPALTPFRHLFDNKYYRQLPLQVMADLKHLGDPRCSDALEWLESKWLPGGGFPREAPNAVAADHVVSRGSHGDWGPSGLRRSNPLVTLATLAVLRLSQLIDAGPDDQ